MTAQKVGPCFFCDEPACLQHGYGPEERNAFGAWCVECMECGARGPEISGGSQGKIAKMAKHEAVKQWNRIAVRKVHPSVA